MGSWGVDLANQESWSIINNGGGDFAVVPEPTTFALLGAAALACWRIASDVAGRASRACPDRFTRIGAALTVRGSSNQSVVSFSFFR